MPLHGDFHGNLERLRDELRRSRYAGEVNSDALAAGEPAGFLPLLHFALLGFSRLVAKWISEEGYELYSKTDLRFIETAYRFLRDNFNYRHALTCKQLLGGGFAERKVLFVVDVLKLCRTKHIDLSRERTKRAKPCDASYQSSSASALSAPRQKSGAPSTRVQRNHLHSSFSQRPAARPSSPPPPSDLTSHSAWELERPSPDRPRETPPPRPLSATDHHASAVPQAMPSSVLCSAAMSEGSSSFISARRVHSGSGAVVLGRGGAAGLPAAVSTPLAIAGQVDLDGEPDNVPYSQPLVGAPPIPWVGWEAEEDVAEEAEAEAAEREEPEEEPAEEAAVMWSPEYPHDDVPSQALDDQYDMHTTMIGTPERSAGGFEEVELHTPPKQRLLLPTALATAAGEPGVVQEADAEGGGEESQPPALGDAQGHGPLVAATTGVMTETDGVEAGGEEDEAPSFFVTQLVSGSSSVRRPSRDATVSARAAGAVSLSRAQLDFGVDELPTLRPHTAPPAARDLGSEAAVTDTDNAAQQPRACEDGYDVAPSETLLLIPPSAPAPDPPPLTEHEQRLASAILSARAPRISSPRAGDAPLHVVGRGVRAEAPAPEPFVDVPPPLDARLAQLDASAALATGGKASAAIEAAGLNVASLTGVIGRLAARVESLCAQQEGTLEALTARMALLEGRMRMLEAVPIASTSPASNLQASHHQASHPQASHPQHDAPPSAPQTPSSFVTPSAVVQLTSRHAPFVTPPRLTAPSAHLGSSASTCDMSAAGTAAEEVAAEVVAAAQEGAGNVDANARTSPWPCAKPTTADKPSLSSMAGMAAQEPTAQPVEVSDAAVLGLASPRRVALADAADAIEVDSGARQPESSPSHAPTPTDAVSHSAQPAERLLLTPLSLPPLTRGPLKSTAAGVENPVLAPGASPLVNSTGDDGHRTTSEKRFASPSTDDKMIAASCRGALSAFMSTRAFIDDVEKRFASTHEALARKFNETQSALAAAAPELS